MQPDPTADKTHMLLVRHGQTPWNAAGRWQGHANPSLSEAGRAQALELARALAAEVLRPWTRIVSSDLARALETAKALAERLRLEIEVDERLRELDVGTWSGSTREEIRGVDPEGLRVFETGDPHVRPGGGESRIALRERAHDFARDLAARSPGEDVIVVTHRGVVRALSPGKDPTNAETIVAIAEEVVARGVDRRHRPGEGLL